MSDFSGQTVVISGVAGGVGTALAEFFSAQGAEVIGIDVRQPDIVTGQFHQADVGDADAIAAIFSSIKKIDILVANAGVHLLAHVNDTTPDQLKAVFNTNTFGTYYCLQAALQKMQAQNYGRVVLMASDQALVGRDLGTAYGMSKAAVVQLAKSASADMCEFDICINALCPAVIEGTKMTEDALSHFAKEWGVDRTEAERRFAEQLPIGRMISREAVVRWAAELCARDCPTTGTAVVMDGGLSSLA